MPLDETLRTRLQTALVEWFVAGHRDMPWRRTKDPYAIWVSEIMLQQTRVDTVRPYYDRWMKRFPTVRALATAPLEDVLSHWRGLGYYARARNLHAAANEVEAQYKGRFPRKPDEIVKLKGIGAYTAGAISSIAYGLPEPIVDGNVARVLTRVFRIKGDPQSKDTKKKLWSLAAELVPHDAASEFNQGLMELGALVCTPTGPRCKRCPLVDDCEAFDRGDPERFPEKKSAAPTPTVRVVSALITDDSGALLMLKRPLSGLWGGLWEPPSRPVEDDEIDDATLKKAMTSVLGSAPKKAVFHSRVTQQLTHRKMIFDVFTASAPTKKLKLHGYDEARWVSHEESERLGVASWTARLLAGSRDMKR